MLYMLRLYSSPSSSSTAPAFANVVSTSAVSLAFAPRRSSSALIAPASAAISSRSVFTRTPRASSTSVFVKNVLNPSHWPRSAIVSLDSRWMRSFSSEITPVAVLALSVPSTSMIFCTSALSSDTPSQVVAHPPLCPGASG